jgi:hypothetical protein
MATVKIRIEATSSDEWERYHGVALDQELSTDFWITQPEKVVDIHSPPFNWEKDYDLPSGTHSVTYGNSGYAKEPSIAPPWHAKIFVNGQQVAEGDVGRDQYLKAQFTVGVPTPTPENLLPIAVGAALGGVLGYALKPGDPLVPVLAGVGLGAAAGYGFTYFGGKIPLPALGETVHLAPRKVVPAGAIASDQAIPPARISGALA